jgi:hypothetical protein
MQAAGALADAFEDRCAVMASAAVPQTAKIVSVSTTPTPNETLSTEGRNQNLRWVTVDVSLALGNRKVVETFRCFRNPFGEMRISRPGPVQ